MVNTEQKFKIRETDTAKNNIQQLNPYRTPGLTETERKLFEAVWHEKPYYQSEISCA